jgi:hypothetical protein
VIDYRTERRARKKIRVPRHDYKRKTQQTLWIGDSYADDFFAIKTGIDRIGIRLFVVRFGWRGTEIRSVRSIVLVAMVIGGVDDAIDERALGSDP